MGVSRSPSSCPKLGCRRPAYQELGIASFDRLGRGGIQAIVILGAAIPLRGTDFHLVPDLEVTEVEVKSVGPTFVVMADDPQADFRPLVEVGRLMNVILAWRMLDALAQPVHHT